MSGLYADVLEVARSYAHLADPEHPAHRADPRHILAARDGALGFATTLISIGGRYTKNHVVTQLGDELSDIARFRPEEAPSRVLSSMPQGLWRIIYQRSVAGQESAKLATFDVDMATAAVAHGAGILEIIGQADSHVLVSGGDHQNELVAHCESLADSAALGYAAMITDSSLFRLGLLPAGTVKLVGVKNAGQAAQAQLHLLEMVRKTGHLLSPEDVQTIISSQARLIHAIDPKKQTTLGKYSHPLSTIDLSEFVDPSRSAPSSAVAQANQLISFSRRNRHPIDYGKAGKVCLGLSTKILQTAYSITTEAVEKGRWWRNQTEVGKPLVAPSKHSARPRVFRILESLPTMHKLGPPLDIPAPPPNASIAL